MFSFYRLFTPVPPLLIRQNAYSNLNLIIYNNNKYNKFIKKFCLIILVAFYLNVYQIIHYIY